MSKQDPVDTVFVFFGVLEQGGQGNEGSIQRRWAYSTSISEQAQEYLGYMPFMESLSFWTSKSLSGVADPHLQYANISLGMYTGD